MKLNTKCWGDSLKKDYSTIGILFGVIGLGIIILSYRGLILTNLAFPIQLFTAVNVFICMSLILSGTVLWFITTDKTTPKQIQNTRTHTIGVCFACGGVPFIIYTLYCMFSGAQHIGTGSPYYPNVDLITITTIIINVLVTPLALAYSRCKE